MKKCKYCGKKFATNTIQCIHCGAIDNFFINAPKDKEKEYYDKLSSIFLDKNLKKKYCKIISNEKKDQKLNKNEDDYYDFLQKKLNENNIKISSSEFNIKNFNENTKNKNLIFCSKKKFFKKEETTFNGIFDKESTLENTFFKKNEANTFEEKEKIKKIIKTRKKLWKILIKLVIILILLIIFLIMLIDKITNKNQKNISFLNNSSALFFFSEIKSMKEEEFLKNPKIIAFPENFDLSTSENEDYLKIFYSLIKGNDYVIKKVKKIETKGNGRALVTYEINGKNFSSKILKNLLFKKNNDGKYSIDFNDFIQRYNRMKNTENSLLK